MQTRPSFCRGFRVFFMAALLAVFQFRLSAAEKFESVAEPDPSMGNYEGSWSAPDGKFKLSGQIRALGSQAFDGFLLFQHDQDHVVAVLLKSSGLNDSGAIKLSGEPSVPAKGGELQPRIVIEARLRNRRMEGSFTGDLGQGTFSAEQVTRQPDTLGAKPPSGAMVIFDGRDTSKFENFNWKLVEGGAMQVGGNNIVAKEKFQDFQLHVEFMTPFMPKARGQARGNSGVYLQSVYEVQVLDSFGLWPLQINDCGSIYGVKAAAGNASLPPLQWQTYDISYREGSPVSKQPPVITVVHNGVKVIDQAPVPEALIGKGGGGGTPGAGFLMLQNHGDPVRYRNIWVLPLNR